MVIWRVELLYRSNLLGDEQLYLFLTILLAFSQVFVFHLSVSAERLVYELFILALGFLHLRLFFLHWSNGWGKLVCWMSADGTAHPSSHETHAQNQRSEQFFDSVVGLLSPFVDHGRSLQHASTSHWSRHVCMLILVSLQIYVSKTRRTASLSESTLPTLEGTAGNPPRRRIN